MIFGGKFLVAVLKTYVCELMILQLLVGQVWSIDFNPLSLVWPHHSWFLFFWSHDHLIKVKDAANMPERARLFAAGLGLTVLDACLFDGQQGFKVKFKRACGLLGHFLSQRRSRTSALSLRKMSDLCWISLWNSATGSSRRPGKTLVLFWRPKVECQNDSEPNLFCKVSFLDKISRLDSHTSGVYKGWGLNLQTWHDGEVICDWWKDCLPYLETLDVHNLAW